MPQMPLNSQAAQASSINRLKQHQGFTLIEIIVVVLIIGIVVSFATLSVSGRSQQDRLNNEAKRLTQLIQLASDEAVLQSLELGLRSKAKGTAYEFLVLGEEGRWLSYDADSPLRERKLPTGISIRITTEGFEAPPADDAREENDDETIRPNILLLSSGEVSPFEIRLKADGAATEQLIRGNLVGKIELIAQNESDKP